MDTETHPPEHVKLQQAAEVTTRSDGTAAGNGECVTRPPPGGRSLVELGAALRALRGMRRWQRGVPALARIQAAARWCWWWSGRPLLVVSELALGAPLPSPGGHAREAPGVPRAGQGSKRRQRRRQRRAIGWLQLALPLGGPSYVPGLDLEPLLRGELIAAMAAVLMRPHAEKSAAVQSEDSIGSAE